MTLHTTISPTEDLELYLGYSRPSGRYASFADIHTRLRALSPSFDFDQALTGDNSRVLSVHDDADQIRAVAVLNGAAIQLYYAEDADVTSALMQSVEQALASC